MKAGQVFNPYKRFFGSMIPNCLMRYNFLGPSAKLLWARLAQFNGKNGKCYPSVQTLSEELGVSKRQIMRLLKELEDNRFILRQRRKKDGRNSSNHYSFLWHECFEAASSDMDVTGDKDTDVPKGNEGNVTQIDSDRIESFEDCDEHSSSANPSICNERESTSINNVPDEENDPLAKTKENCASTHNEKRKGGTSPSQQKNSDLKRVRIAHEKLWVTIYPDSIYPEWTGKDYRVAEALIRKLTSVDRVEQLFNYIAPRWSEYKTKWRVDGPTMEVISSYGAGLIGEMDMYNASIKRTQDNRINQSQDTGGHAREVQRINPEELANGFKRKA